MCQKYKFIHDEVKIDFPVPLLLQNEMDEAEELDRLGSTEFFCVAESIDVIAKGLFAAGKITQEQWDRLTWRYPVE